MFRRSLLLHLLILLFFPYAATTTPTPRSLVHQVQQRQAAEAAYVDNANGKQYPVIATPNCSAFDTREYLNRNDIPLPCLEKDSEYAAVNSPPQYAPPVPAPTSLSNGGNDEDSSVGSTTTLGPTTVEDGTAGDDAPRTASPQDPNTESDSEPRVRVTLFVGIRPFIPNIEPIVTAAVTKWLNSTIQNMDFFLFDPFLATRQRHRNLRYQSSPRRRIQDDSVLGIEAGSGGGEFFQPQQEQDGSSSSSLFPSLHAPVFTLIHFDTESDLVVKTNRRWYWKHTVSYDCLYRQDRSPVLDLTLLRYVTENVTQALAENDDDDGDHGNKGEESDAASDSNNDNNHHSGLTMTLRQRTGDEGVTITIKPEELPSTAPDDMESSVGTREPGLDEGESLQPPADDWGASKATGDDDGDGNASGGGGVTYTTPLDAQYWDWRRWFGLSLFLGTIMGTFVLSQIHAHRQRRLIKSQVWGNLASEEGINELLKTGWKVQGTSNDKKVLEIYDKSKWGYRENDSMLIGGFEQREAVVGAEITLTHAPSETNTQANNSVTHESHHTPPSPVAATRTPTGSVLNNTTSTVPSQHQYGSPPTTPPHGGGGGPSTTRTTNSPNNGSSPL